MTEDQHRPDDQLDERVEIEDATAPDESIEADVGEDEPELLESSPARSLADDTGVAEGDAGGDPAPARVLAADDTSDAAAVDNSDLAAADATEPAWDREYSAHRVIVELKRVESQVREILEERDTKRKRKLAGTRRWQELHDDIIAWRYAGRFEEDTLRRLEDLIARRHFLFRHLNFLAATRPTWNT